MVHRFRGSSKRALTIALGLCVLCTLFLISPYAFEKGTDGRQLHEDLAYDLPFAAPSAGSFQLNQPPEQQDALRQQQQVLHEQKPVAADSHQNHLDDDEDEDEDEAVEDDGLPTEYKDDLLPSESRQKLKFKIGAQALRSFLTPTVQAERRVAVGYILRQANNAYRNQTVYSVVRKPASKIPPSGDRHDYSSLARYFWRNPDTKDGLPYVRWDGKPNPEMDSVWDYRLMRKMFRDCVFMGQAYFWTGEERYAEKIVYRVKEWFLDEETKMNPNLKYGSLIFGHDLGRAQGVLDMFKVYGMFDALKMIEGSRAMSSEPTLISDLQTWFTDYLDWIDSSVQAEQERNAKNNHGTYFSVQYVAILEFLGLTKEAKQYCEEAKETRLRPQLQHNGAQPHETARPISFFYSTFNLQGLMLLAMQAEAHGVDLWHYKAPKEELVVHFNKKTSKKLKMGGATIEDAVWFVSDYATRDLSEWPYPDSGTRDLPDVLKMAKIAKLVYGQGNRPWKKMIVKLEEKILQDKLEKEANEADQDEDKDNNVAEDEDEEKKEAKDEEADDNEDTNGFLCELGVLSKGSLWHCYK
ncbi:hypothetical protein EMPS_07036 [Entomortierella parvispora]|uniref:Alginate lyase domain-containing protein n=1 Tax=Entomortierella parvispora TaxID=205924 RepID=A0A9P3LY26_9FUNG|nr:hypothetical protein EMPS_07036 [Entomortierella parvispora]